MITNLRAKEVLQMQKNEISCFDRVVKTGSIPDIVKGCYTVEVEISRHSV